MWALEIIRAVWQFSVGKVAGIKRGKEQHLIIVAEGVGSAFEIGDRIREATGVDPRVTVLGHIQRGGSPTGRDRETASRMGYAAVNALAEGRGNCIVGTNEGHLVEIPIEEALAMTKQLQMERYDVLEALANTVGKAARSPY